MLHLQKKKKKVQCVFFFSYKKKTEKEEKSAIFEHCTIFNDSKMFQQIDAISGFKILTNVLNNILFFWGGGGTLKLTANPVVILKHVL